MAPSLTWDTAVARSARASGVLAQPTPGALGRSVAQATMESRTSRVPRLQTAGAWGSARALRSCMTAQRVGSAEWATWCSAQAAVLGAVGTLAAQVWMARQLSLVPRRPAAGVMACARAQQRSSIAPHVGGAPSVTTSHARAAGTLTALENSAAPAQMEREISPVLRLRTAGARIGAKGLRRPMIAQQAFSAGSARLCSALEVVLGALGKNVVLAARESIIFLAHRLQLDGVWGSARELPRGGIAPCCLLSRTWRSRGWSGWSSAAARSLHVLSTQSRTGLT